MNIFRTFALGITMVGLMMPHATQAEENTATARFFYSETCPTCHVMRAYMDQVCALNPDVPIEMPDTSVNPEAWQSACEGAGMPKHPATMIDRMVIKTPGYQDKTICGVFSEGETQTDEHYVYDRSMEYMLECKKKGKTFCSFLSTNAPHDPYCVPKEIYDLYIRAGFRYGKRACQRFSIQYVGQIIKKLIHLGTSSFSGKRKTTVVLTMALRKMKLRSLVFHIFLKVFGNLFSPFYHRAVILLKPNFFSNLLIGHALHFEVQNLAVALRQGFHKALEPQLIQHFMLEFTVWIGDILRPIFTVLLYLFHRDGRSHICPRMMPFPIAVDSFAADACLIEILHRAIEPQFINHRLPILLLDDF